MLGIEGLGIKLCCSDMDEMVMMADIRQNLIYVGELPKGERLMLWWKDCDCTPLRYCPSCGKKIEYTEPAVSGNRTNGQDGNGFRNDIDGLGIARRSGGDCPRQSWKWSGHHRDDDGPVQMDIRDAWNLRRDGMTEYYFTMTVRFTADTETRKEARDIAESFADDVWLPLCDADVWDVQLDETDESGKKVEE